MYEDTALSHTECAVFMYILQPALQYFFPLCVYSSWQLCIQALTKSKRVFALCCEIMEEGFSPPIALFYGSIKFHDIYESACHEADGLLAFI